MRYLALDLGRKRIGLALSDETGLISSPAGVIQVRHSEQVFTEIESLVKQNEVGKLIIGLPIQLNGREGIEAERARVFAAELGGRISVPVDFMDERLSSVEAERRLIDSGKRGQKIRDNIDATAAALILQTYLDRERRRK
ncbi:MAG: Holliday junction resolvase RuvX [Chloroflexi bacterium]|uniref:Putative pre-16S rRNA nuclease n=1 Tax=Candidatus Chlorohelix allophototropha TaxID=3003348 RepID=A0A8T7LQM0_9CHLR|nr:Holliday junction resolvase RuvX [Chloroflexota bacterium]WJW66208.1 Holliday junction resolvase RuvX [Chloroflexota bacterium L227-S17]